jgi:hypothetical protein
MLKHMKITMKFCKSEKSENLSITRAKSSGFPCWMSSFAWFEVIICFFYFSTLKIKKIISKPSEWNDPSDMTSLTIAVGWIPRKTISEHSRLLLYFNINLNKLYSNYLVIISWSSEVRETRVIECKMVRKSLFWWFSHSLTGGRENH